MFPDETEVGAEKKEVEVFAVPDNSSVYNEFGTVTTLLYIVWCDWNLLQNLKSDMCDGEHFSQ